jgi:hypothetical protein
VPLPTVFWDRHPSLVFGKKSDTVAGGINCSTLSPSQAVTKREVAATTTVAISSATAPANGLPLVTWRMPTLVGTMSNMQDRDKITFDVSQPAGETGRKHRSVGDTAGQRPRTRLPASTASWWHSSFGRSPRLSIHQYQRRAEWIMRRSRGQGSG